MLENGRRIGFLGETAEQKQARIQKIKELIASGQYQVDPNSLAEAILDWNPRSNKLENPSEAMLKKRAYTREYMQQRRATAKQNTLPEIA